MDYLNIGPCPANEQCEPAGGDPVKANKECRLFIEQIRRALGTEPPGARLATRSFPHDFGLYREVVCYFNENDEDAIAYAFKCEAEAPLNWDEIAKSQL